MAYNNYKPFTSRDHAQWALAQHTRTLSLGPRPALGPGRLGSLSAELMRVPAIRHSNTRTFGDASPPGSGLRIPDSGFPIPDPYYAAICHCIRIYSAI